MYCRETSASSGVDFDFADSKARAALVKNEACASSAAGVADQQHLGRKDYDASISIATMRYAAVC